MLIDYSRSSTPFIGEIEQFVLTRKQEIDLFKASPYAQCPDRLTGLFLRAILVGTALPSLCLAAFSFSVYSVVASALVFTVCMVAGSIYRHKYHVLMRLNMNYRDLHKMECTELLCRHALAAFKGKNWGLAICFAESLRSVSATSFRNEILWIDKEMKELSNYLNPENKKKMDADFKSFLCKDEHASPDHPLYKQGYSWISMLLGVSYLHFAIANFNEGFSERAKDSAQRAKYWLETEGMALDLTEAAILNQIINYS